jgi:hypothetical protein
MQRDREIAAISRREGPIPNLGAEEGMSVTGPGNSAPKRRIRNAKFGSQKAIFDEELSIPQRYTLGYAKILGRGSVP